MLAGLWEFPGGRVEEGETDAQALTREVLERVGIEVEVGACIGRRTHDYDGYSVDLALYQTTPRRRRAHGGSRRGLPLGDVGRVREYQFPAADQATMDLLLGIKRG